MVKWSVFHTEYKGSIPFIRNPLMRQYVAKKLQWKNKINSYLWKLKYRVFKT